MCVQCGKRIQSRCARVKMVTSKVSRKFAGENCKGNVAETVVLEEQLRDEVETV